jgi:hypothetical protein
MFPAPRYLEWALRFYGQVPFDLASSGIPQVRHEDLGDLPSLDDPRGGSRLVAAIAGYNDVPVDEVAPALGTTYALWLAYATLLSPGDEVLVETPGYEPLWRIAEGVGATVHRFERPAGEAYRLDPERVAAKLTARTRVVAVSNLHNPSGARATDDVLREIAGVAASRGAYLLVDEVYAPFDSLVGVDGIWGRSAHRLAPNIIAASSLTKCFGLGHQRVGWLLASREIATAAQGTILSTVGHLPQEHASLAAHAFARLPSLAARARDLTGAKRVAVQRWAGTRADMTWSAPDSGLFGFATCTSPEDLTGHIEAAAVHDGILVAPGSFFGVPNGFRLSWSISTELLGEGLERLGRVLAQRSGGRAMPDRSL